MVKGTITFEFETLADLARQMRLVLIDEVRGALDRTLAIPIPSSSPVESLTAEETTDTTTTPCPTPPSESTEATMEEVRQITRQVAAAATTVSVMVEGATVPAGQNSPTLNLENLATEPYPELLAFCTRHPEVGVNVAMCQPAFFRKLVECKIKTYLESK